MIDVIDLLKLCRVSHLLSNSEFPSDPVHVEYEKKEGIPWGLENPLF